MKAPTCPEYGREMVPRVSNTRTYANGDRRRTTIGDVP